MYKLTKGRNVKEIYLRNSVRFPTLFVKLLTFIANNMNYNGRFFVITIFQDTVLILKPPVIKNTFLVRLSEMGLCVFVLREILAVPE